MYPHVRESRFGLLCPESHGPDGGKGESIIRGKSEDEGKGLRVLPKRQALGHRKPGPMTRHHHEALLHFSPTVCQPWGQVPL